MTGVSSLKGKSVVAAPRSVPNSKLKSMLQTFDGAVRKATDKDGNVGLAWLKTNLRAAKGGKQTQAVFARLVSVLESRYATRERVSASCGGVAYEAVPARRLTPQRVALVLKAVLEARARGIDKLDRNDDGKVTSREAQKDLGAGLADQLAEVAARSATEEKKKPRRPQHPPPRPSPVRTNVGC
jgi:hypothetical protein